MKITEWKNEKGEKVYFIKIIDLLNKIANGEEVPKKIAYHGFEFEFDELERQYIHNDNDLDMTMNGLKYSSLTEEVEIIEENKPIKELEFDREEKYITTIVGTTNKMRNIDVTFADKINELVKEIKKIKEN